MTMARTKPFAVPKNSSPMVFSIVLSVLAVQMLYKPMGESYNGITSSHEVEAEQYSGMQGVFPVTDTKLMQPSFDTITELGSGTTSQWLRTDISKVEDMQKLERGWDGYFAEAPNPTTISKTLAVLHTLSQLNLEPTRVAPSAEGGITLAFFDGGRYGDVELLNSGEVLAVVSSGDGDPQIWDVESDANILETLGRIRDYIWCG